MPKRIVADTEAAAADLEVVEAAAAVEEAAEEVDAEGADSAADHGRYIT